MTDQQVNDTSTDLIVIGDDFTLPIVPTAQVKAIAARLLPMLPTFPKPFSPPEATLVAEIALARGHNPLSVGKSFHAWKDNFGKVCIQDHFAAEETWAQSKEKFRAIYHDLDETEKAAVGISAKDYACACTILRASYEHLYQERYNSILNAAIIAKVPFDEALKIAEREALKIGVTHIGRVKYEEVFSEDGKVKKGGGGDLVGWLPGVTRSHVRALRGAIHQVYGTPTFAEMARLGLKSTAEDMPEILAEMPDEVARLPQPLQQKWVNLDERRRENDESEEMLKKMLGPEKYAIYSHHRQQKNTTLMRGEVLVDDWLDEKKPLGPSEVDDLMNEDNPQVSALEDELANEALSLGGVVAPPVTDAVFSFEDLPIMPDEIASPKDDVGVAMSIGDVKSAMAPVYPNSDTQLKVVKAIYGDEVKWEDLTQPQLWNVKEYSKRMFILHKQTSISVAERLAKIPEVVWVNTELVGAEPITTLDGAKDMLKGTVREMGRVKKLAELTV